MEDSSIQHLQNSRMQSAGLYSSLQRLVGDLAEEHQRKLLTEALEEVMITLEEMESTDDDLIQKNMALTQVETQLATERQRYLDLFESAPEAYLVTDSKGLVQEANLAAARLLKSRRDRIAGKPIFDFFVESEQAAFRSDLEQLNDDNRVLHWPVRLRPRHGEPFDVEMSVTRVCLSPGVTELRWMLHKAQNTCPSDRLFQQACEELRSAHESAQEVTMRRLNELEEANRRLEAQIAERRRVEDEIVNRSRDLERRLERRTAQYQEATRSQDSMARFLGDICANPLRALDSQARQLADRWGHSLPPEGRRQMASVLAKTQNLDSLLESVSAYARVAKQPMEPEKIDTAALVAEVLQELEAERDGRCVEIRIGDLSECDGDPALLRMAFTHLLSNAFKFTRTRDVAIIEINCRRVRQETVWTVRDNGIGFRKDQAHRLFAPFQRLHRTQGYDGAGVGLATVQRIAARHDGRAWAESHDQGASFSFSLGSASSSPSLRP